MYSLSIYNIVDVEYDTAYLPVHNWVVEKTHLMMLWFFLFPIYFHKHFKYYSILCTHFVNKTLKRVGRCRCYHLALFS